MKEVRLKIVGTFSYEGAPDDRMEFVTEGKMYERNGKIYLTYDESELSGMEGSRVRLKIDEDSVSMHRRGKSVAIDSEMAFCKGKRFSSYYETPYGAIPMEVLTNELKADVSYEEERGTVTIDYDVSLKGLSESRSLLNIEVEKIV